MLREFGQKRLQPIIMALALKPSVHRVMERLLPLVTVQNCAECPMLKHCTLACVGFRNLCLKYSICKK